jgi:hypothetical protein
MSKTATHHKPELAIYRSFLPQTLAEHSKRLKAAGLSGTFAAIRLPSEVEGMAVRGACLDEMDTEQWIIRAIVWSFGETLLAHGGDADELAAKLEKAE